MNLLGIVATGTAGLGLILTNGVSSPGAHSRVGHSNTYAIVRTPGGTNLPRVMAPTTNAPLAMPKPGIYKSAPSTTLVIVPDGRIDERFVIGGGAGGAPEMPTIVPHLDLNPWKPAKP